MRIPLAVANWKMNHSVGETRAFFDSWSEQKKTTKTEVVLCPPFTSLSVFSEKKRAGSFFLGAQNCHWEDKGAYTGEISPLFLADLGCIYVILGHSERRHIFGETDEVINRKVKAVVNHQLIPIFCVGETLSQREADQTLAVIEKQLFAGLKEVDPETVDELVVAYEPVWAIGTGKNATPDQAQEVHVQIRQWITKNWGEEWGQKTRILYGGSVTPKNSGVLMDQPDIDGVLVGGASLKVDTFLEIVNSGARAP